MSAYFEVVVACADIGISDYDFVKYRVGTCHIVVGDAIGYGNISAGTHLQVYETFGIDGIAQSYCILYYGAGVLTDNFCQNGFCGLDAVIV